MTLAPLATVGDLADRNITVPASMNAAAVLASASSAVRDAAGCLITAATSTITLIAEDWRELELPFGPVSAVDEVFAAGVPVAGWTKLGDTLLMPPRWTRYLPIEVTVTYTHGYPQIPADLVDLVCAITAQVFLTDGDYGSGSVRTNIRLGDYSESFRLPAGADSPSPVELPDTTRERLRARFGSAAGVLKVH